MGRWGGGRHRNTVSVGGCGRGLWYTDEGTSVSDCRTPSQGASSLMASSVRLGLGLKFKFSFSSLFLFQDLSALAKELRELRVEEGSRPPVKVKTLVLMVMMMSAVFYKRHQPHVVVVRIPNTLTHTHTH